MAQRKHLTFKKLDPKKVKLIGLIFLLSFILSPQVRYTTGDLIIATGQLIQSTSN